METTDYSFTKKQSSYALDWFNAILIILILIILLILVFLYDYGTDLFNLIFSNEKIENLVGQ
nr:hypothetical protein [Saprospiraceae bacterium]